MSSILSYLAPFGFGAGGRVQYDDDFTDRLNHTYSVIVLIIFSVMVTTKQYVGDPIHCWVPGYFTSNYADYTNKICWVSNTYFLPFGEDIPKPQEPRKMIAYYQWIPMSMLFQAVLFYLPRVVWRSFNSKAGVDVHSIVDNALALQEPDKKDRTMKQMVKQMDRYLGHFRVEKANCVESMKMMMTKHCNLFCGKKYGNYLVGLYLITKFLFLFNVLSQLFILDWFLGSDFHFYGIHVLRAMTSDDEWPGTSRFPHATMCDFKVRQLGNIQRHTVQCVLPINFFNEKIYLFIWFWFALVSIVTAFSLIVWLARLIFRSDQVRFVRSHLRAVDKIQKSEDKKILRRFVHDYLRHDGVLVLRLVEGNTNDLAVAELIGELWDYFRTNPPSFKRGFSQEEEEELV